jgi:predicted ATPase
LFVITGGPGAGKTTVLLELGKRGFRFSPEVARQIIKEQMLIGGRALPWADRNLYTDLMLKRSIESYREHTPASTPAFSDRGIPDTLGYALMIGLPDVGYIQRACDQYRYAPIVFHAPAWKEIYTTDAERKQDFAEAERTSDLIARVYRECGYEVVEIPRLSPAARADYIVKQLPSGV